MKKLILFLSLAILIPTIAFAEGSISLEIDYNPELEYKALFIGDMKEPGYVGSQGEPLHFLAGFSLYAGARACGLNRDMAIGLTTLVNAVNEIKDGKFSFLDFWFTQAGMASAMIIEDILIELKILKFE